MEKVKLPFNKKEPFNPPTNEQKKQMAKLNIELLKYSFNLFVFMARVRKAKGYFPPVEAIIKISQQALKTKPTNIWGYFVKALKEEFPKYFADLNIQEAQKYKTEPFIKIGDLLK